VALLGIAAASLARAQTTADAEAMYRRYLGLGSLVRNAAVRAAWLPDGSGFWFALGAPESTVVYRVDPRANTREPLFDVSRLRQALRRDLGREPPGSGLPFRQFSFGDGQRSVRFALEGRDYELRLADYLLRALPPGSEAERARFTPRVARPRFPFTGADLLESLSPDSSWFLTFKDHDVWLRSTGDGRSVQLTSDGTEHYAWQSGAWSPDGRLVLAVKVDDRAVHKVPIVHWLGREEAVEWLPFPLTGGVLSHSELHVLEVASGRARRIDTGATPGEQYIWPLAWRQSGSEFLFLRMTRNWKVVELLAANPSTGASRVILVERQPTFIKGIALNPGVVNLLTQVGDDRHLIWQSERDGWDHLYLYDFDGKLVRRLTSGAFPVLEVQGVDPRRGWVYFTAHAEPRIYDTHLYRAPLWTSAGMQRLTEAEGQHEVQLSPSREFFLDTHSTPLRPPVVELRRADGALLQTLARADTMGLAALRRTPPEEVVVKAADGVTDLHGILYKPYDFDPSRKYPVIEYIYAGPQVSIVPRTFVPGGALGNDIQFGYALAQMGYLLFVVDGRGTTERGKAFQDVVYGNLGRYEIPDHAAALRNAAATRPYMDLERVGVFGASYGGFFTIRAMLLAPELYRVGVATAPAGSRSDGPSSSVEPYMDVPSTFPEALRYSSNEPLMGRLRGKLLMIIGTSDLNTPFANTMRYVDELARADKPYSLIVLPEMNHSIRYRDGTGRHPYWRESVKRFFLENLEPGGAAGRQGGGHE
jgi:dipeptidyl aminopeptidase/acylaminoacyl peptidase